MANSSKGCTAVLIQDDYNQSWIEIWPELIENSKVRALVQERMVADFLNTNDYSSLDEVDEDDGGFIPSLG